MLERARVRPTKDTIRVQIEIPRAEKAAVIKVFKKMGVPWSLVEDPKAIPAREAEAFMGELTPGRALASLRYKEGLTQVELGKKTGLSQHRISEMERGKRGISKNAAKILGKALKADYRLML